MKHHLFRIKTLIVLLFPIALFWFLPLQSFAEVSYVNIDGSDVMIGTESSDYGINYGNQGWLIYAVGYHGNKLDNTYKFIYNTATSTSWESCEQYSKNQLIPRLDGYQLSERGDIPINEWNSTFDMNLPLPYSSGFQTNQEGVKAFVKERYEFILQTMFPNAYAQYHDVYLETENEEDRVYIVMEPVYWFNIKPNNNAIATTGIKYIIGTTYSYSKCLTERYFTSIYRNLYYATSTWGTSGTIGEDSYTNYDF